MPEKSYFRLRLDSTIRETEKLLKLLRTIGESRDLESALQMSVTAAKLSEGVALRTRALPAHTGHPQAERMVQEAISESVPVDISLTEEGWFYLRTFMFFMGKSERLKDDSGLLDILSEFCYTIGKQSKGGR